MENEEKNDFLNAVEDGDVSRVREMLRNNKRLGEIARFADDGRTPLNIAAREDNIEIVKLLLDSGVWHLLSENVIVNKADYNGWTPLHAAVYYGHERIVKLLLDSGAVINKANKFGYTPLMEAAREGHIRIVKLLLDSGADINAGDMKNKLNVIEYFYDNPEIFSDQQYNRIIRENFRPMDPKKMCMENTDGEYVDFISYEQITSTSSSPSKQNRLLLWARVPRNPEASLNKIIYDCFTLDTFMGIGKRGFKHPMTREKIAEDKVGIYYVESNASSSSSSSSSSTGGSRSRTKSGKRKSKRSQRRPPNAVCTRAQKLGIRLTVKRNNKRVYKSEKVLRTQIKNAVTQRNKRKQQK